MARNIFKYVNNLINEFFLVFFFSGKSITTVVNCSFLSRRESIAVKSIGTMSPRPQVCQVYAYSYAYLCSIQRKMIRAGVS